MYREKIDLNCDMGEGFGHWQYGDAPDSALMPLISSANIATGYHAGDPNQMDKVVRLAKNFNVKIGAHPGYKDLQGFGRRTISASPEELVNDIVYQTGALREFCRRYGYNLQHVKPHGALYMDFASRTDMSEALVDTIRSIDPSLYIYCMSVSKTFEAASNKKHPTVREFYADRDYDNSGSIVFIRKMRQLDPNEIAEKCLKACKKGKVKTVEGNEIDIQFESICFHSDTPGALNIGTAIKTTLEEHGIKIQAPQTSLGGKA